MNRKQKNESMKQSDWNAQPVDEAAIRRVHLVFKTHLDIGFTNLAANIVQLYFDSLIPKALALSQSLRDAHGPERFRWTTGSWLIYHYLENASPAGRRKMEKAIELGDFIWHAMPFTTHTELMDASLFRHGLSLSQKLDKRFGRKTIAAKLTDVPGHSRAMVPLLAEAGVKFLHIGVNPASSGPDVPPVFLWRDAATHTQVIVNYHKKYGETTMLAGLDDALAIVFTGDNKGPQSREEVIEKFQQRRDRFANAKIIASSFDDFARKLWPLREKLPVIEAELGDTWIHGCGTDPTKVARFKTLQRLRSDWLAADPSLAKRDDVRKMSDQLLMVAEHTWGLDEKENLGDEKTYERDAFEKARRRKKWRRFESSWDEQRQYIDKALESLKPDLQFQALQAMDRLTPQRLPLLTQQNLSNKAAAIVTPRWQVKVDRRTGGLVELTDRRTGHRWADGSHALGVLSYQTFTERDYARFKDQYLWRQPMWAIKDFTKPGMDIAQPRSQRVHASSAAWCAARVDHATLLGVQVQFKGDIFTKFGCPPLLIMRWLLPDGDEPVSLTIDWFDKPACRVAEAIWLTWRPRVTSPAQWRLRKMGQQVDPLQVARKGAKKLHAVEQISHEDRGCRFELALLDSPLVAPGEPSLLDFNQRQPSLSRGMHVNLYNNVWGTNFPMWSQGDARARFALKLTS